MMKKRNAYWDLALAALLFVGCAEDITINNGNGQFIAFRVSEAGMATVTDDLVTGTTRMSEFVPSNGLFTPSVYPLSQKSAAQTSVAQPIESDFKEPLFMTITTEPLSHKASTRGTETVTSALNAASQTIGVTAYPTTTTTSPLLSSVTATYSTADNLFHTSQPWGNSASTSYDFYAWHPATLSATNGLSISGETITYDISGLTSANMKDLLGAKEVNKSYNSSTQKDGSVDLTFSHLLTPVRFQLASGFDGTITSIKFENIVTKADHTLGTTHTTYGYDWETNKTTAAWTSQTLNTTGDPSSAKQVDGTEYFMMIPQTIAAGTVVTIGLTAGSNNYTLQYATPAALVWKAGELVTYTISSTALTALKVNYPCQTNKARYTNDNTNYDGCGWKSGSGTTAADFTDGPYSAYTASDHFGLFAVNTSTGKIVISNLDITGIAGSSFDINPTSYTSVYFSDQYRYFLMYPYVSDLTTTYPSLGLNQSNINTNAEDFFAAVISAWDPYTNQPDQSVELDFKGQDLQVGMYDAAALLPAKAFDMKHQMGVLAGDISMSTSGEDIITYNGYDLSTGTITSTVEVWPTNRSATSATWYPSSDFSSSTYVPHKPSGKQELYYIIKPSNQAVTFDATLNTSKYDWSVTISANTITNKNDYHAFTSDITVPTYLFNKKIWNFNYSGGGMRWVAPHLEKYTFECWGAKGGDMSTISGGLGGYVKGTTSNKLPVNDAYYIFVGQYGGLSDASHKDLTNGAKKFNGGGGNYWTGTSYNSGCGGCGGGASDVRIVQAPNTGQDWSNSASLNSRILVAGGGGGAASWYNTCVGGAGGGLIGYEGAFSGSNGSHSYDSRMTASTGGTQTDGGIGWKWDGSMLNTAAGSFGIGGTSPNVSSKGWRSGGGGGWYGGGSGGPTNGEGCVGSAAGGSSYIAGHPGCKGSDGNKGSKLTINGKDYSFTDRKMIDGNNLLWDGDQTEGSGSETIPVKPSGSSDNNGYCRITLEPSALQPL